MERVATTPLPTEYGLNQEERKHLGLETLGVSITTLRPLEIPPSDLFRGDLRTKKEKLGHKLSSV